MKQPSRSVAYMFTPRARTHVKYVWPVVAVLPVVAIVVFTWEERKEASAAWNSTYNGRIMPSRREQIKQERKQRERNRINREQHEKQETE